MSYLYCFSRSNQEDMSSLMPHGMHTHYTHSEWWHTHTHTHTCTCRWDVGGKCSLHLTHPGVLPQGQPGAVGGQQCGARGPSPSVRSWRGQGQDRRASVLFACFCCYGVLWGEPGWARGEHANSTQKGPGTRPDMLHHAGLEPTTFLLWGNSATHWATMPPCITYFCYTLIILVFLFYRWYFWATSGTSFSLRMNNVLSINIYNRCMGWKTNRPSRLC